jgi:hypothetical protein
MTKLARMPVVLVPLMLALVGCAPNADAPPRATAPAPTPTLSVTDPAAEASDDPSAAALPSGAGVQDWAAAALPENRPGGGGWVSRAAAPVGPSGAIVDLAQPSGVFEVVLVCESTDASPLTLITETGSQGESEPSTLPCNAPGAAPTQITTIIYDADPTARLRISAENDAVYVYEVRPHADPAG